MNDGNKKIADKFSLDSHVYSLEAVKRAAYDNSSEIQFSITSEHLKIIIELSCNDKENIERIKSRFMRDALDHQVRIDVAEEFKLLREMIVAQAFEPCKNLEEVVSRLVDNDKL